jgi:RNA polymerase sigma-70 factor, ECF subfamily
VTGADAELARAQREEWAGLLAPLVRLAGDLQLAEDSLADAFAAAVVAWRRDGVPDNPAAWLAVVARRRAIDRIRRDRSRTERAAQLARLAGDAADAADAGGGGGGGGGGDAPAEPGDDRLRLVFTCCHPVLDLPSRVALTLRAVGGLSTGEIARLFLVAEATMGKRIVRAKQRIAAARVGYRVPGPEELPGRLDAVLRVVYLIFTEGYAATSGEHLVRRELCDEAIRLGRLLAELLPAQSEVHGLLALMLVQDARRDARVDRSGRYVALDQQDQRLWEHAKIREGLAALRRAGEPGPYQLQAAIAALHLAPPGDTDWAAVAHLYDRLRRLRPSAVVALAHAAAVGYADGPSAGLALLRPLLAEPALRRYQPLQATLADLLRRAGDTTGAAQAYRRAIELTGNGVERDELLRRLAAL